MVSLNNIDCHLKKILIGESENERYQKGMKIRLSSLERRLSSNICGCPGIFLRRFPFFDEPCFGDFNIRTGLDGKICELLTVVMLAALGSADMQVKSQVEGALKAGNPKEEVVRGFVHASGYMGIPRLFNALNLSKDLLSE